MLGARDAGIQPDNPSCTSVAVSAPGAGTADDQDLAATGRWRQAIFAMVIGQTR